MREQKIPEALEACNHREIIGVIIVIVPAEKKTKISFYFEGIILKKVNYETLVKADFDFDLLNYLSGTESILQNESDG